MGRVFLKIYYYNYINKVGDTVLIRLYQEALMMKKFLAIAIFAALSLSACTQSAEQKTTEASQEEGSVAAGEESKEDTAILGTWAYIDGSVVRDSVNMTFNENLSGNNSMVGDFKYTADGKVVVLSFTDNRVYTDPIDYEYRIEGDKLVIVDEMKMETFYQKR